jgi:hypothetical protein
MQWKALLVAPLLAAIGMAPQRGRADESVAEKLAEATSKLTEGQTYLLRYGYAPGEQLRYRVEHDANVETTIQGTTQRTRSHSESTKIWEIQASDGQQQFRLTHRVQDAQMWSEVSGRQRVEYDSRSDQPPPPEYASVAESLKKPLATIVIDSRGRVVERQDEVQQIDLGFGAVAIPFPEQAVPVGFAWTSPFELKVRLDDGRYKQIKIQQRYELQEVKTGVATIDVRTQVLTPIRDAKIQSQLVQRMSAGKIRFDMTAGRVISKELAWDESVVAFNGADSQLRYSSKFTDRLLDDTQEMARRQDYDAPAAER